MNNGISLPLLFKSSSKSSSKNTKKIRLNDKKKRSKSKSSGGSDKFSIKTNKKSKKKDKKVKFIDTFINGSYLDEIESESIYRRQHEVDSKKFKKITKK
jgi:hypothetical protein